MKDYVGCNKRKILAVRVILLEFRRRPTKLNRR
jgi:hypothetical protein